MEQENLLSCPTQNSVSENVEYLNYYGSTQPLASGSTNYYPESNFMREDSLSSCSSYQNASCSYQQNESSSYQNASCSSKQNECSSFQNASCSSQQNEFSSYQNASCSFQQKECSSYQNASCSPPQNESSSYQNASCSSQQNECPSFQNASCSSQQNECLSYHKASYSSQQNEFSSNHKASCSSQQSECLTCQKPSNIYEDECNSETDYCELDQPSISHEHISQAGPSHKDTSQAGPSHKDTSQAGPSHKDTSSESTFVKNLPFTSICTCDSDDSSDDKKEEENEISIFGEIVNELFEEIVIEHCFQVHQAKKLGALIFDDATEATSEEQKDSPVSTVTCPNCLKEHELKDYKNKLGECMGLTTRKSKRTTRAQSNFAEPPIDSFPGAGPSKVCKKRKQQPKKTTKSAKPRLQQDDYDIYSKEAAGHATKSGKGRSKKGNYSTHKPQSKSTMPGPMLDFSYRPNTSYQDEFETIDVDTVEETTPYPSYSSYIPDDSPPEYSNSLVTRSEENGKIKLTIKSDPQISQKKKKKKKSKHDYYPGPI